MSMAQDALDSYLSATPHGAFAVDARIKVAPCPPHDPFLRRLR